MRVAVTWSPQHWELGIGTLVSWPDVVLWLFPHPFHIRPAIRAPCQGGRVYHRLNNVYIDGKCTQNKIIEASLAHSVPVCIFVKRSARLVFDGPNAILHVPFATFSLTKW